MKKEEQKIKTKVFYSIAFCFSPNSSLSLSLPLSLVLPLFLALSPNNAHSRDHPPGPRGPAQVPQSRLVLGERVPRAPRRGAQRAPEPREGRGVQGGDPGPQGEVEERDRCGQEDWRGGGGGRRGPGGGGHFFEMRLGEEEVANKCERAASSERCE